MAAAYLLWLLAAGDFNPSGASELNTLRARLAAAAEAEADRGGRSAGLGVLASVASLFAAPERLESWRDEVLGDVVEGVQASLPPPPPPPALLGPAGRSPQRSRLGSGVGGAADGAAGAAGGRAQAGADAYPGATRGPGDGADARASMVGPRS